MGFNISDYSVRIGNDINDIFYAKDNSLDSKVERIRNLAEIIGRFILDWGTERSVTLGEIKEELKKVEKNSMLINAVSIINDFGVDYAHTQKTKPASKKILERGKESLNDMFSFIFIRYFQKYEFGSNAQVERAFSLLPPIIRYKTLAFLYENGGMKNREIIMKLTLALLKSSNEKKARRWLDEHQENLKTMISTPCEQLNARFGSCWQQYYYVDDLPLNFYDECTLKVKDVSYMLKNSGSMYKSFEEAAHFYELNGTVYGDTPEIIEFNRNMEFVYAGRIPIPNEKNPDDYTAANIFVVNRIK